MSIAARSLLAFCALVQLAASPRAQKPATPSPELQKLGPMIGNWAGSGTMTEPSATTKWTASGSYRWVLGGFWMQEDFALTFAGNPDPLVFRSYLGWDGERKTFVNVTANNGGEVAVHDFTMQPDGTMLQLMLQHQQGAPYAERSLVKVDGDTMTHSLDVLMGKGPSMALIAGTLQRQDAEAPSALDAKGTWMHAKPHESMQKLAHAAGSYEAKCELVMTPGAPAMKIAGVDTWRTVFGGTVLHARTDAAIEGVPGRYECDVFWAWNDRKRCLVLIAVNNMGAVGLMEARFAADGKALVATRAMTMDGQPSVARTVIGLDDEGRLKTILAHLMVGTSAPIEHFRGTFAKK